MNNSIDDYCIVEKNDHTLNDNENTDIIISQSPKISPNMITTSTQTEDNISRKYCLPCPSFCIPVHYEYEEETIPLLPNSRYNRQSDLDLIIERWENKILDVSYKVEDILFKIKNNCCNCWNNYSKTNLTDTYDSPV